LSMDHEAICLLSGKKATVRTSFLWPSGSAPTERVFLVYAVLRLQSLMVPLDSGVSRPAKPERLSHVVQTPMATRRMSSPSLSPQITDRSPQDPWTRASSCGTSKVYASSPLTKTHTPTGYHASDTSKTQNNQSLSQHLGIRPSRFGITNR